VLATFDDLGERSENTFFSQVTLKKFRTDFFNKLLDPPFQRDAVPI
jgi:hypothetical protein